jgi:inner membrane protein
MAWWIWILLGFGFLAAETVTPGGFFAFFFGVSSIAVGLLSYLDLAGPPWVQWILFSMFSVASLLFVRPRLAGRFMPDSNSRERLPDLVGDVAVLLEDLDPDGVAKAELRGTSWSVRSRHPARLARGSRCVVRQVEGLTLWVEPQRG